MDGATADLVSGGGLLAFAGAVFWEVRAIRATLAELTKHTTLIEERTRRCVVLPARADTSDDDG